MNKFSACLGSSAGAVIRAMDTRGQGISLVVYNPLAINRKDLVEAEILYPDGAPKAVKVFDALSNEVPVQILYTSKDRIRILFLCSIPSLGLVCFDVQQTSSASDAKTSLSASASMLDNEFIKVAINAAGDISSIIDKKLGKELLSAPSRLEFQKEHPEYWPAWNMDWNDRKKPPIAFVKGPAKITVLEKGPVRATVKIERTAMNSVFTQYLQLTAGKENLIVRNTINWQSRGVSLKASFPLTAANNMATYNLGLGTESRSNNNEKKYEVPSREWFDLTDKSGNFGVTIFEDSKFGSDKPNDKTLRLTLLYTPTTNFFHDQATQDWGIHEITYGIYSHKGDWRTGLSEWQGRSLNQPLRVFQVSQHPGFLGKSFSFAQVSLPQVDIRAIKKAENGKDIVIRLQELTGKDIPGVEVAMASKILKAWEIDGQERLIGEATLKNGKLQVEMTQFAIRSYAIQLAPPAEKFVEPSSIELPIVYDQDVVSSARNKKNGGFGNHGITIPAEQFPETVIADGVQFTLGPNTDAKNNVLACRGQKINLPKTGNYKYVYILAAALTDTSGIFKVGSYKTTLNIQAYRGYIGQFDNRTWDKLGRFTGLQKGFIKRDEVAWHSTRLYQDTLTLPYQYAYVFKYRLNASPASETLQLPDNESIKIFAITVADNPSDDVRPAKALYDDFTNRPSMVLQPMRSYVDENMAPEVEIGTYSNSNLGKLPARLTMKDYADMHQPNGVTVKYFFKDADTTLTGSGTLTGSKTPSGSITSGMSVPSINDGMYDLLPADSLSDKWSESGEGRLVMDLQRQIEIDSIHIFTGQNTRRGGQSFSLWGATGENQPDVKGDPKSSGWSFMAYAPPEEIWGNSKALYTVIPLPEKSKQYRYIMWISENTPHGPMYFREVDVFEKQN
jgi:alpha-mannosidase